MNAALWHEDLEFFAAELVKRHKNAFHRVQRQQFNRAMAELDARLPALQDYEIVVGFQSLAAMFGDGHTFVATWERQRRYPLDLLWFDGELRVVRAAPDYRQALGRRLVAVAGRSIGQVQRRVQRVIPQGENTWYVLHQSAGQIARADVLAALGIAPDIHHAPFAFQVDQGQRLTLKIASVSPEVKVEYLDVVQDPPLTLQRVDEPFWFACLPGTALVYVSFRGYDSLEANARRLFAFIDQLPARGLAIDLRHNGGGNFDLVRQHILPRLKERPALNARGNLFVIIGRGTFSAAMTNAADFRKETRAILVGEPTGARPNGYQENDWFSLPQSGLRVSVACEYYQFLDEDVPAVMPDHLVPPNWPDYRAGRDPAMEWILHTGYLPCEPEST